MSPEGDTQVMNFTSDDNLIIPSKTALKGFENEVILVIYVISCSY